MPLRVRVGHAARGNRGRLEDLAHMQKDHYLTVLRDLPEFKALLPPANPAEKQ